MDRTTTTVSAVRTVGPDAVTIDVATPADFDAAPGQFVKFSLPSVADEPRFYTISSPTVTETVEITVEIDDDGTLGPHIAALEPGDEVALSGPFGSAYYEGEDRVVLLAGGPGVGPAIGIAERTLDDGGQAALIYRDDEPIHEDRLAALADRGVDVSVLSEDDAVGTVAAEVITGGGDEQVFVYGFADFLDVATDAIEAAGGDAGQAKVENFG
ncbi:FAD-dependent oxidoreductase [Halorhabdus sp. CUG00001]|uniref:FAD-dependent oxidoreductase n=1 Tax=Halorhabdus sp. CUG00001 TaxID=2600297 RepID=UPI00131C1F16|nr:FAD-dependent oxidoreductase [Halorhabdus sp. CUG00001]